MGSVDSLKGDDTMLIQASNPREYEEEEEESTPSLSEAFAKAQSTLSISEKSEESKPVETDETKEPEETPETKESLETKSEEDLESIDPKSLPPELKTHYDNLMKGFTKGRQKDSEARKNAEKERDEFKRQLLELKSKAENSDGFSELTPEQVQRLTPQEQSQYYQALTDFKAQKAVEAQKLEDFRSQALNDYESSDIRLQRPTDDKPNEKYDRFMDSAIGAALDEALDEYVQLNGSELGFPYKEHLSRLVEEYDGYIKNTNKLFIQTQNQKLKESSEKLNKTSPTTSKGAAVQNKPSLSEAIKLATEKLAK